MANPKKTQVPIPERLVRLGRFLAGVLALVLLWIGINSILVGLAYHQQKGFWVPCLVGALLVWAGVALAFGLTRLFFPRRY